MGLPYAYLWPVGDLSSPANAAYRPAAAPMTELLALHQRLRDQPRRAGAGSLLSNGPSCAIVCAGDDRRALPGRGAHRRRHERCGIAGAARWRRARHPLQLRGHLPGERNLDQLRRLAERVRPLGWHALLHGHLEQLLPALDAWRDLVMPLVIDHMARQDATRELDEPGLKQLEQHLQHEQCWIKLSGVDRMMQGAAPPWDAASPVARRLLDAAPERAIWGTDWPHPNIQGAAPDDGRLLDFVDVCRGSAAAAEAVLVHNPRRLYF